MDKLDLKKARKALFTAPRGEFAALVVPRALYLMADGHGDPNAAPDYARAPPFLGRGDERAAHAAAALLRTDENPFEERDRRGLAAVDVVAPQRDLGEGDDFARFLRHERRDVAAGARKVGGHFRPAHLERLAGPQRQPQADERIDVAVLREPDHRPP